MKNAIIPGLIIGVLSGIWLFIMRLMHIPFNSPQVSPIEFVSVLIPLVGLYYGVKNYAFNEMHGKMNFLEGLVHGFKILIVAGIFVVFVGIVYVNYIDSKEVNWADFSGRIFAALLIGVLSSLAVSLLLMHRHEVEESETDD
ncbi:MAG TPA: DUF4199 domain-containing protein [Mucilaginibacter sp.]|jgi:hypothetical protein|nr:DUF4199 domain-containing protein [Mucilaginibacter sp.]